MTLVCQVNKEVKIMANDIIDHMICGVCKGAKVLVSEVTGKSELCPKCEGRGQIIPTAELQENLKGKKRVLLKG